MATKRPRSTLTEAQSLFVDAKMEGMTDTAAGKAAGAANGSGFSNSTTVREQLAAARRWLTDTTQIKRLDVVEGILRSVEMGEMMSDPAAVRQGWVEIGKILGHYAPEVKRIELSMAQGRMLAKFEGMSDQELMQLAEGNVIDGDCSQVQ